VRAVKRGGIVADGDETMFDGVPGDDDHPPTDSPPNRRGWWLALGVLGLGVLIGVILALVLSGDNEKKVASDVSSKASTTTSSTSSTSTTTTTVPPTTAPPSTAANPSGGGGGSGGTTATTTGGGGTPSTTAASTGPVITSYTSSTTQIACPAPDVSTSLPPPTVTLYWQTKNTTGVDISIDGPGVYGSYGPSGQQTFNIGCDGNTHTYMLTAKGTNGQTVSQTISVQTKK
jgi:hypothetical protein